MKRLERIDRILNLLNEKGNLSTVYLARRFNISESSIRRDLFQIISENRHEEIERVHGGIILKRGMNGLEYMFELKLGLHVEEKKAIARKASEFIEDGDNIILDSGTTCLFISRLLYKRKNLKILTLDIKIAEELGKYENIESTVVGGIIRPGYYSVGGSLAVRNLEQFSADKVFLSVDAIEAEIGITNISEFEVRTKQKIIELGEKIIVTADSSKFGNRAFYKVAGLSRVDTIITDRNIESIESIESITTDKIREFEIDLIQV